MTPKQTNSSEPKTRSGRTARLGRSGWGALLAIVFCQVTTGAVIVHTLAPTADTQVRSTAEKKNFGAEPQIELRMSATGGSAGGVAEGYLQFPLPPHAPHAEKIVLRLHAQLSDPGTARVMVRSVAPAPWAESDLTWRTRPEHKETIGTLSIVGLSGAWYEVDVTAYVKAEAAAGHQAALFALVPGEESRNRIIIQSRESMQKKPGLVFTRQPIAVRISFLPAKATPPEGHLADHGEVFGLRPNGFFYGWSADNTEFVRDRTDSRYRHDKSPPLKTSDRRYDFTAYMDHEKMKAPLLWEMGLPGGTYQVRLIAGDSFKYDSIFGLTAEKITVIDGVPDTKNRWFEATVQLGVTDGRLTIGHTPGATNNKLCFIEVTEIQNLPTPSP